MELEAWRLHTFPHHGHGQLAWVMSFPPSSLSSPLSDPSGSGAGFLPMTNRWWRAGDGDDSGTDDRQAGGK